jgi:hypothetical protein
MEKALGTHWIVGWVGLRASLDVVVRRKIPGSHRGSITHSSNPLPSAIPLRYAGSPVTVINVIYS